LLEETIMKEFGRTILVFLVFTILTGFIYPFAMTKLAHWFFPKQAEGSLIINGGKVTGSSLIGQKFVVSQYFHGRPSANSYDAANSGGANFGPDSAQFLADVNSRVNLIRQENNLKPTDHVPADLVLASASGLDPHISLEGALLQAQRIAKARQLTEGEVKRLIERMTEGRGGPFVPGRVNVLAINMALDSLKDR
jgi:K+-transporting ATPase ATPase C chain